MQANAEMSIDRNGFARVRVTIGGDNFDLSRAEAGELVADIAAAWFKAHEHNKAVAGPEGRLPEGPGHAAH